MKYFTELVERLGKALRIIKTALPEVPGGLASTYRPESVHVSPEQPVAPEVSPADAPSPPAVVGE